MKNTSFFLFITLFFLSCTTSISNEKEIQTISEGEIIGAQKAWAIGLIGIGVAYQNKGDYKETAKKHIEKFYGYDMGKVLFKPTLASEKPFRMTMEGALSYYIGDNPSYPKDEGFALTRWKNVRWENAGIINSPDSNIAVAMGNYYFENEAGEEVKYEYSFCYKKDNQGKIKIVAHKSALPFKE